ncbi:hypothetical protein BK139_03320 [Paenibacillus sp. FSL R5-0490]|uniref:sce7726 family protein n=1 Tax=Bacillales TaxID=1385 RepID=UPI00096DD4F3|nr:sce7726 family protein [Paenibacillus sp. FSL R5-0490]OMF62418.1 hypothetical protein BK139_03320 [Paenibacillus sp. FSL R5-0490]
MLTDFDIRAKLIEKIHKENRGKHYRVIEELVICDGLARADVALANGIFHGFEIKSDHDSLERLANQIECYDKTFDKNTIVVGQKFEDRIADYIPSHWGIQVAYVNRYGTISIKKIRSTKMNKKISLHNLLDLLWNVELRSYLKENKVRGYSKKDRTGLKEMAIENITFKLLKDYTRETLKTRTGWREDLP